MVESHVIRVHMVGLPPRTEAKWKRYFDVSRTISRRPFIPPRHRPQQGSPIPQGGMDNVRVSVRIAPP